MVSMLTSRPSSLNQPRLSATSAGTYGAIGILLMRTFVSGCAWAASEKTRAIASSTVRFRFMFCPSSGYEGRLMRFDVPAQHAPLDAHEQRVQRVAEQPERDHPGVHVRHAERA